jgi:hypothetical protein
VAITTRATPTNITAGTITTVTNLTNAPTAGDLTATMKTSVTTAATAATPVAASVTGNVGGNVTGSVGSVIAGVTLAASAVQAIWDALTTALTTAGSIGKRLADFITGDAFVRLGAPAGASVSADITTRATQASVDAVQTDVDTVVAAIDATGAADLDAIKAKTDLLTLAAINAEMVDALNVDTYAEPGQEAPPATTTIQTKLGYLYKMLRNKKTQTVTTRSLFNDGGTVVDQTATDGEESGTYTKGELGTGP